MRSRSAHRDRDDFAHPALGGEPVHHGFALLQPLNAGLLVNAQGLLTTRAYGTSFGGFLTGGYLGARTAMARGARFVRAFFLLVVSGFVVRLGGDVLGWW